LQNNLLIPRETGKTLKRGDQVIKFAYTISSIYASFAVCHKIAYKLFVCEHCRSPTYSVTSLIISGKVSETLPQAEEVGRFRL
jgi:hypothetical protein